MIRKRLVAGIGLIAAALGIFFLGACTNDAPKNQQPGQNIADNRKIYNPVNDVEGSNYNARLRLADQPSTLLWCTFYPPTPGVKPYTVPIVGKLTSSNKRPTPPTQVNPNKDAGIYNPDLAGPDGFYGPSAEYRYGFDPAGHYHDFYNLAGTCTDVPDIIQKRDTELDIKVTIDPTTLDKQVEAALAACDKAQADALKKAGKDPTALDPTLGCPAADALLNGAGG